MSKMTQDQRTAFVKLVDEIRANDDLLHYDYDAERQRKSAVRAAAEKARKLAPLRAAMDAAERRFAEAKDSYRQVDALVDEDVRAAEHERNREQAAVQQKYIAARSEILSLDDPADAHKLIQRLMPQK